MSLTDRPRATPPTTPPTTRPNTPPTTPPSTRPSSRPPAARRPRPGTAGLFRAFWRWHAYAGVLVVPVLVVLSATGLVYLFRFQLEPLLHADVMTVEQPAGVDFAQGYSAQLAAVERAHPELTPVSLAEPREEGRATVVSTLTADGETRDVFVDPWTLEVTGVLDPDRTLSGYAVLLHGELMAGRLGDAVIELAACWAIVVALTGYYLLAKGRAARRRRRAARAAGARLRSTHALVGSVVGVGLLLLLVSGLPWTGYWGERVQAIATGQGSSLWSTDHGAVSDPASTLDESLPHSHAVDLPWALQESEVPSSGPAGAGAHGGEGGEPGRRSVADVDTAVAVADAEGLRHPLTVALPTGDDGTYSVIGYAFDAPSDERTVHVDRFGGQVVSTYGYADYPALAKVVAHGIGLHEGRSLGLWSFWGAAAMCVAILAACVTGPVMWWRRRPRGSASLGAPRGRVSLGRSPLLLVLVVGLGVLLPLFGLSLVLVLALDQLVLRRVPALAGFFDVSER